MKFMIVDDHADMRRMLRNIISLNRTEPIDFMECDSGESAIQEFVLFKPDVILMDIELKKMNGFEAISAIQKLDEKACVIIITSYDSTYFRKKAQALHIEGFVCKDRISDISELLLSIQQTK